VLGLTTLPGHDVDDRVHPLTSRRRAAFDVSRAGSAAFERFRFRVTP
jgi:hypothetical protein